MFPLILNYWREVVIGLLVTSVATLLVLYSLVKKDLQTEIALKEGVITALNMQSSMIEANRAEYETNLATANKRKDKVLTWYKTRIETIYVWGENNATCDDAMRYINSYSF